jgi:hypothetical protein
VRRHVSAYNGCSGENDGFGVGHSADRAA